MRNCMHSVPQPHRLLPHAATCREVVDAMTVPLPGVPAVKAEGQPFSAMGVNLIRYLAAGSMLCSIPTVAGRLLSAGKQGMRGKEIW